MHSTSCFGRRVNVRIVLTSMGERFWPVVHKGK